jgi:hypothetical protein
LARKNEEKSSNFTPKFTAHSLSPTEEEPTNKASLKPKIIEINNIGLLFRRV